MRIGIVGAGMSGMGAARELTARGHNAVVFDSHTVPGGRVSTLRVDGYVFDMGATVIAPRGRLLQQVMQDELATDDLKIVKRPVYTHTALRPSPGDAARLIVDRFVYGVGNDALAHLLADGLDMRLGQTVLELEQTAGRYTVRGEDFDGLILTPPAPETARLLAMLDQRRSLANCTYRMCLSVALGFAKELPPQPYFALVDPLQRHPLTWLSFESLKCGGRAPEGHTAMVAQLSAEFSAAHIDAEDAVIVGTTVGLLERLLGPGWDAPAVAKVYRWPYSHPENVGLFESVNSARSRVLVAGDGLAGARVEYAYEVGARTARLLTEAS